MAKAEIMEGEKTLLEFYQAWMRETPGGETGGGDGWDSLAESGSAIEGDISWDDLAGVGESGGEIPPVAQERRSPRDWLGDLARKSGEALNAWRERTREANLDVFEEMILIIITGFMKL